MYDRTLTTPIVTYYSIIIILKGAFFDWFGTFGSNLWEEVE